MTASSLLGLHHVTLVASERAADGGLLHERPRPAPHQQRPSTSTTPAATTSTSPTTPATRGRSSRSSSGPRTAPRGRTGIGGTHHVALRVSDTDALLKWKRRLTDMGIGVKGPIRSSLLHVDDFRDPDGVILEIAILVLGMLMDETGKIVQRTPPAEKLRGHRDEAAIAATTRPEPVPNP